MKRMAIAFVLACLVLAGCSGNEKSSQPDSGDFNAMLEGLENPPEEESGEVFFLIEDSQGEEISEQILALWQAANGIYNVDDTSAFDMGEEPHLLRDNAPAYTELLNYDAVVDATFTAAGKAQLEATEFAMDSTSFPLLVKENDSVYRAVGDKTGTSFAEEVVGIEILRSEADKMVLNMKYSAKQGDATIDGEADFTIVKENNVWRVDDYRYPEAH